MPKRGLPTSSTGRSRCATSALGLAWAACATLATSTPAAAAPDPFVEFSQKYRCPIADRLSRLYDAGDPAIDRDRFLAVEVPDRGPSDRPSGGYVQCLFHDRETRVLCEASSGFYEAAPGTPRTAYLPPHKIAALGRLGFSTDDSAGNFSLDVAVPKSPDFGALADLILHALYDGYDVRIETTLTFKAPFAPGLTLACDPVG